jgi:serine/threonine protein kinase
MTYQSGDLILEKYRVDTLIGEGACGEVYRVIKVADKTQRAIKVFSQSTIGTGNLGFFNCRQRFRFENQLAERLNTPNPNPYLLQIYDFIDTKECMVLEMEYAPGGSLRGKMLSYTQRGLSYPREKALRIASDVAIGLGTLHRSGIVHHNLKATNVLFNLRDRIVFSDLGMAQGIAQFENSSLLNYSNPTPDLAGSINLDRRLAADFASPSTDIFALGNILFEMITGKDYSKLPPHSRLRDFIPGIKPSLDDLIYSMLHESAGLKELDATTVSHELQRELEAEEQAQREILSRKYDELAEWERLKNSELSRQKGSAANQPTKPVSEIKGKTKTESPKEQIKPVEIITPAREEFPNPVENGNGKKPEVSEFEPVGTEIQEENNSSSHERVGIEIPRKALLIFILALIILAVAGYVYLNYFQHKVQPAPVVEPKNQVTRSVVATKNTGVPSNIPTLAPRPDSSQQADAPTVELPAPSNQPAAATVSIQVPNPPASNLIYSAANPGFEDTSNWALKIGDSHILGKFTNEWASEGSNSYKIYMTGDAKFEYCLVSGIRTTINQTVDLTDVDEVLFDMKFKPAPVMKDSQGNPFHTKAVAFVDKEQLYLSNDNPEGIQLNQKMTLNKGFPGKHELKIGLMTTYKFCVKGRNEADNLTLYIDNIRLVTR